MSANAALASCFGQALALDLLTSIFISELDKGRSHKKILGTLRFCREAGPEEIGKFVAENKEFMPLFNVERKKIEAGYEGVFDRAVSTFEAAQRGDLLAPSMSGLSRHNFLAVIDEIRGVSFE